MRIRTRSPIKKAGTALGTATLAAGLLIAPATAASANESHHHHNDSDVAVAQTNLVSDQALTGDPNVLVDPNLVNPWGMSFGTGAGATPLWVSDNGKDVSTLYKTGPTPPAFIKLGLTVSIPGGAPTGQVENPSTTEFVVHDGTASGAAKFIFASEAGLITGWNPNVPAPGSTQATQAAQVPNAVFKGLAMASANGADYLYAADFSNGTIDVFNSTFAVQKWAGAFRDKHIPASYGPFNVQSLNGALYVSYAKKKAGTFDDEAGLGHGFVDVFDTSGHLVRRLVSHDALNSPWGLAIAPSSWGRLSGALLVGNFGDGRIHAYNPKNGRSMGALRDAHHKVITIEGLWGLMPGNGVAADPQSVIFTAGPGDEAHGLLGILTGTVTPDGDD
jgi:uncharacterized protein (TIGR03118 family)